jgi:hypothetical protein
MEYPLRLLNNPLRFSLSCTYSIYSGRKYIEADRFFLGSVYRAQLLLVVDAAEKEEKKYTLYLGDRHKGEAVVDQ